MGNSISQEEEAHPQPPQIKEYEIFRGMYYVGIENIDYMRSIGMGTLWVEKTYEAIPKKSKFRWEKHTTSMEGQKGTRIGNFLRVYHDNGLTYYIKLEPKSAKTNPLEMSQYINMVHTTYVPTHFQESDWAELDKVLFQPQHY